MNQLQWLVTLSLTFGLLALLVVVVWVSYRTGGLGSPTLRARTLKQVPGWKLVRRLVIGIVGVSVILVGIAMMVLPGPAIVVIPLGLAILATEFAWAKRVLDRVKHHAARAGQRAGVTGSENSLMTRLGLERFFKRQPDDSTDTGAEGRTGTPNKGKPTHLDGDDPESKSTPSRSTPDSASR